MVVISELIDRMKHGNFEKARAEPRQVTDLDALQQAKAILNSTKEPAEKMYCYWILGDLGRNTKASEVADYLMERVAVEKTARDRKAVLMQVCLLDGATHAEGALALIRDKNRDLRHTAIQALGACRNVQCEEALIGLVESNEDPAATRHAAIALVRIGTERCAPPLVVLFRRLPRDRMHEVTVAAVLLALSRIGHAKALPLAVGELGASRSQFVNWACMLVIAQHGNRQQIDAVVDRLTALLRQEKRQDMTYVINLIDTDYDDEFTAGVSFLCQFPDQQVERFFDDLREKSDLLFQREKDFLHSGTRTSRKPAR